MSYLRTKPSFEKYSSNTILPITVGIGEVNTFTESISPKVNVIPTLEFEFTHFDAADYPSDTSPFFFLSISPFICNFHEIFMYFFFHFFFSSSISIFIPVPIFLSLLLPTLSSFISLHFCLSFFNFSVFILFLNGSTQLDGAVQYTNG